MSLEKTVEITCPKCERVQIAQIWQSVNVTLDPEARQALLEGTLNQFHCLACGHMALIHQSLLYHDMDRQFIVWYMPPSLLDDKRFFDDFTPDGILQAYQDKSGYFKHTHLVFDMNELVRYLIFRERLYEVSSTKLFVVAANQEFNRDIAAENIKVAGKVVGNLVAQDLVEILSTGTVIGDVTAQRMLVAQGGIFKGQVHLPQG